MGRVLSRIFCKPNSEPDSNLRITSGGAENSKKTAGKSSIKYVLVEKKKSQVCPNAIIPPAIMEGMSEKGLVTTIPLPTNMPEPNRKDPAALKSYEFIWRGGASKVILTGAFDEWSQSILMARDHANGVFRSTIRLDPTKKWIFKFVVDGTWRCSDDFAIETDKFGNANNVIHPMESQAFQDAFKPAEGMGAWA